jgi:hypothetical protein
MGNSDFLNIVDIVGQYVPIVPEGKAHYLGKCPFCPAEEGSLVISVENQYWSCLSCGAHGDRYDFVAQSEHVSRAEAILMVAHHTNSRELFPHAVFKPGAPAATTPHMPEQAAAAPSPAPAPPQPQPPKAETAATQPDTEKGLLAPFLRFRDIIPSYQGAAILDHQSKMMVFDSDYAFSADLAGTGEILAPVLAQATAVLAQSGNNISEPCTLTFASDELAILMHKFSPADESMVLMVRLANPSDMPIARRLVASASAKLA